MSASQTETNDSCLWAIGLVADLPFSVLHTPLHTHSPLLLPSLPRQIEIQMSRGGPDNNQYVSATSAQTLLKRNIRGVKMR